MEDGTRPPQVQTQPQLLPVQEAPCSLWPGIPQGLVPPRLPPLEANRGGFSELPVAFSLELTPHDPEACRPLVRRVARRAPHAGQPLPGWPWGRDSSVWPPFAAPESSYTLVLGGQPSVEMGPAA